MKIAAIKALVILAMSGCSFALVTGPSDPPGPTEECTTVPAAPIVDAVLGAPGLAIGGLVVLLVGPEIYRSHRAGLPAGSDGVTAMTLGIPILIAGAAYTAASVYGFNRTARCRQAIASHRAADERAAGA